MAPDRASAPVRIADRAGAEALVAEVMGLMQALETVLGEESAHVREGRLRQGLDLTQRKTALAASYFQGLETAKLNAVALARFAPQGVETLKAGHRRFAQAVEANQTVLATAKTVSEGLIKSLADEIGRSRAPSVYGAPSVAPSPYGRGTRSGPLVLSRSL
ncbi:hypothetical protein [Methylobacterium oxalidis]|uniref:Flagellar basal-body protein FlbY n=1 Tax=Methylobacterium oxalidis TaxID=944322 RepID=A0A512J0D8_9HYPH|nr:hypothetical protein [Methylobacterium oxalidis]GEP03434.1 hypothetical protein MOX02_14720 [Methylobacterium oxalidis]GJE30230.1 hypothetical protein LDDCCGHA_0395 [Methylobacterium oxalidis]GLS63361.1 hypothetical protein GCM10007888_17420 [Methylobacterium oxalidis]